VNKRWRWLTFVVGVFLVVATLGCSNPTSTGSGRTPTSTSKTTEESKSKVPPRDPG
jgi:hypothetical protein